jgi:hypothetical protein
LYITTPFSMPCHHGTIGISTQIIGDGMAESLENPPASEAPQAPNLQDRLLSSVLCPHCHQKFKFEDTLWVATHPDLKGDLLAGPSANARFRPTRFNVAGEALDPKGSPCREMACPHCHLIFPRILLENDPLYISVVGAPFSGKTAFLGAMIAQQRIHFPRDFSLAFGDVDTSGNNFFEPAEATMTPATPATAGLRKTPPGISPTPWPGANYLQTRQKEQDVNLSRPLLYMVRPEGVHPNANNPDIGARTVCFYDNSGVNYLPSEDPKVPFATSHLQRSKILFLVFDPTQAPIVREKLLQTSTDPQLVRGPIHNQDTLIRETANRLRAFSGLSSSQRIERPVLVLMTKADLWLPLLGEDLTKDPYVYPTATSAIRCCRLDLARVESLSDKLDQWVKTSAPDVHSALKESFAGVRFIPLTASGQSPVLANGKYTFDNQTLAPRWACVPLLYAFARFSTTMVVGTGVTV